MSTVVSWNASSYTVPATGEENWGGVTKVDGLLVALVSHGFQKTGGLFTLSADADFGASFGLKSIYYKDRSSNPSSTGILRVGNDVVAVGARNAANGGDVTLKCTSSDIWQFSSKLQVSGNSSTSIGSNSTDVYVDDNFRVGGSAGPQIAVTSSRMAFSTTVRWSALTATTVPYLDANKDLQSSATTPTQLGYLSSATGTTGTTSTNLVFSASPTFSGTITAPILTPGSANSAQSGVYRLANDESIAWRNAAASADKALKVNSSDQLTYAGTAFLSSAGVALPAAGGTGVANNAANTITFSGNYALTLTLSNTTSVTLPTSGTLATLAGAEALSNKTSVASAYFATSAANPGQSGVVRLANDESITWRNAAASADKALKVDSSDRLVYAGTPFLSSAAVLLAAAFPALTGDVTTSAGAVATTLAATTNGTLTSLTAAAGVAVHGTNTNDSASAGYVGEASTATGTTVSVAASGDYGDVTSISLSAGDWDISCIIFFENNGATVTSANFGIGTATGNSASGLTGGSTMTYLGASLASNSGGAIPSYRVSISGATTYYLKIRASYSVATPQVSGTIRARRLR